MLERFLLGRACLSKLLATSSSKIFCVNNSVSQLESPSPESVRPRSKFGARLPAEGRGKGELWLGTSARLIGVRVRWSDLFKDAHGGLWYIARHCQICAALANPVRRVREALKALRAAHLSLTSSVPHAFAIRFERRSYVNAGFIGKEWFSAQTDFIVGRSV
jgi:hypothetical protein